MMLPRIIAICGKRRSGKDTIANYICSKYPEFVNVKIAGQLKTVVRNLFGFSEEQLENDTKDMVDCRWGITTRAAMQYVVTEMMQFGIQGLLPDIGRKFWIKSFIETFVADTKCNGIVVSDLRFLHEYEELAKYNVYVIRVEKNDQHCGKADEHISETECTNIPADVVIHNDGTLEELLVKVDNSMPCK